MLAELSTNVWIRRAPTVDDNIQCLQCVLDIITHKSYNPSNIMQHCCMHVYLGIQE